MGIVFDEVVADVRPDREETLREEEARGAKPGPSLEEIEAALARRVRFKARLEAH